MKHVTESPLEIDRLRDHLIHNHRRSRHEIAGLPLPTVHQLEHLDATLGLLDLNHRHTG